MSKSAWYVLAFVVGVVLGALFVLGALQGLETGGR